MELLSPIHSFLSEPVPKHTPNSFQYKDFFIELIENKNLTPTNFRLAIDPLGLSRNSLFFSYLK